MGLEPLKVLRAFCGPRFECW